MFEARLGTHLLHRVLFAKLAYIKGFDKTLTAASSRQADQKSASVAIGTRVTDQREGQCRTIEIVGPDESDQLPPVSASLTLSPALY
jgi:transcription elongation GreA/GreB family factor